MLKPLMTDNWKNESHMLLDAIEELPEHQLLSLVEILIDNEYRTNINPAKNILQWKTVLQEDRYSNYDPSFGSHSYQRLPELKTTFKFKIDQFRDLAQLKKKAPLLSQRSTSHFKST